MDIALLLITVAPGLFLLWYFYTRDKNREPKRLILKVFIWGVVALFPMAFLEILLEDLFSFETIQPWWLSIFLISFASAALIEEGGKYIVVKRFAYRSPHFNEVMDGIVYAIVASLGMATLENILYVSDGGLGVALLRAVTAVPSHAFASGIMGYFIGLAKFAPNKEVKRKLFLKGLLVAIIFHGSYNFFLFTESIAALLVFPLLFLEYRMIHQYVKLAHTQKAPDTLSLKFLWHDIRKYTWVGVFKIIVATILIAAGLIVACGLGLMYSDYQLNLNELLNGITFGTALPWLIGYLIYHGRFKNLKKGEVPT